jgi:NadR type nicotinamide-nucleotide adenylyltransferase
MTRAYVLLTAMPPTNGHLNLIRFASNLATYVEVILCTQPGEPFTEERYIALAEATNNMPAVNIHRIHRKLPQEPEEAVDFWDMWAGFLTDNGLTPDDYIVASEKYGVKLAEVTGAKFMPYDIDRSITATKATRVRLDPYLHFEDVLPEFQWLLRPRITVFGAESTGKTTISRELAGAHKSLWLPEYARPYLETVGNDITNESMRAIWHGQQALQVHAESVATDSRFIIQDTDLFSTVGYWEFWHPGECPSGLIEDAKNGESDLYLIMSSKDFPFEEDPLRYGGDHREATDEYWIALAQQYGLNYVIIDGLADRELRFHEADKAIMDYFDKQAEALNYVRIGNH